MTRTPAPTTAQANAVFLLTAVLTLVSSLYFQSIVGFGANLWINEYVLILLPPLLLARVQGWPLEEVYRLKGTSRRTLLLSVPAGVSLWIFSSYLSKMGRLLLDSSIGVLPVNEALESTGSSPYQAVLLLIGIIVLAPICEEIMFRGFVQAAYERRSPQYGYLISGVIFGAYHILNGVSEVIPASVLGVAMGYLASKTGSLAPSMLFHAAANLCAAFLGAPVGLTTAGQPSSWMHAVAPSALVAALVLLHSVESKCCQDGPGTTEERTPLKGVVFLVLAIIYLLSVGAAEIAARLAS